MIFFGPADFTHGSGLLPQFDHPKVKDARKRVAEVAIAHGKFAGTVGSPQNLEELIKMGYRFVNIGADVVSIGQSCKELVSEFNKRCNGGR